MADEQSDNDGQPDRWGKMAYRHFDVDRQSDGLIVELTGGVTDRCVIDILIGCQMDMQYDGWKGVMDRLAVSQFDSGMDRRVDLQTDGVNGWSCR